MARKAESRKDQPSAAQSWPQPHSNPHLLGHKEPLVQFFEAQASGRLAHAWLMTGPWGIGKATLVYKLASHLLGEQADRLIAAGTHPNILSVARGFDDRKGRMAGEIPVDAARQVLPFLRMTSSDGSWRVAFIDGADFLNAQGQNAILKILEEPPAKSILFLTATSASRLLPTIRSRCRELPLRPLAPAQIAELLTRYMPELDGPARQALCAASRGSIGLALRLAENNGRGMAFAAMLEKLLAQGNAWPHGEYTALAADAARTDSDFMLLAEEILETAIGDEIRRRMRGQTARLLPNLPLEPLLASWDKIGEQLRAARESYLDLRLVWLDVLRSLAVTSAGTTAATGNA